MINKKAKWEEDINKDIDDTSADIITNCLKTSNETLSLWYVKDEDEINKAIVALSSNRDYINKLDYIVIPDEYIEKYKLKLKKSPGDSPYTEFNENHFDIVNVKYGVLGDVSKMVFEIVNNGDKIKRISMGKIKKLLIDANSKKILDKSVMKESLLEEIS